MARNGAGDFTVNARMSGTLSSLIVRLDERRLL